MSAVIAWFRNNLVTIVEILNVVIDLIEVVINGLARVGLTTKWVKRVHDTLKFIDEPLRKLKEFLVSPK